LQLAREIGRAGAGVGLQQGDQSAVEFIQQQGAVGAQGVVRTR
jgi:hypothetical protein